MNRPNEDDVHVRGNVSVRRLEYTVRIPNDRRQLGENAGNIRRSIIFSMRVWDEGKNERGSDSGAVTCNGKDGTYKYGRLYTRKLRERLSCIPKTTIIIIRTVIILSSESSYLRPNKRAVFVEADEQPTSGRAANKLRRHARHARHAAKRAVEGHRYTT